MIRRWSVLGVLVLGSLILAACGTISASTALDQWATSSNLSGALAQLRLDARHAVIELTARSPSTKMVRTVCSVLDLETRQANASLPTPDAQTTTLLSAAYTDLGSGANECYEAGSSLTKRAVATDYLRRAGAEMAEAQARVSAVTGPS